MSKLNKEQLKKINSSIVVNVLSGKFIFGRFIVLLNVLSVMVSWHFNKSVGWAIFHYIFGFWNLLYNLLSYRFADGGFMEIIQSYF